jgi:hypothetical protein
VQDLGWFDEWEERCVAVLLVLHEVDLEDMVSTEGVTLESKPVTFRLK